MEHYQGKTLNGRYLLTDKLGEGGMARVYWAHDLHLNRMRVAIKQNLLNNAAADFQLFQEEVRVLVELLRTPERPGNIPAIYDYQVDQDQTQIIQYLVMDYIPGEDLEQMTLRLGKLETNIALYWVSQIMHALETLHAHQPQPIIHRDIKPSNIRVHAQTHTAFLVDFGIAGSSPQILITPSFSPPEQYRGFRFSDARSDIYALGSTLFTLVTGDVLPPAPDRLASPVPLPQHPALPNKSVLREAIARATQIDADLRFQKISEFRQALTSLIPSQLPRLSGKNRPLESAPLPLVPAPPLAPHRKSEWFSEQSTFQTTQMKATPRGQLITGHTSKAIKFWNVSNWSQPAQLLKSDWHADWISSLAVSNYASQLRVASGGHDWNIQLWDATNGKLLMPPLKGHQKKVTALAFSRDGQQLASAGEDGLILIWDLSSRPPRARMISTGLVALGLDLSADGTTLVGAGLNGSIHVWNLVTRQPENIPNDVTLQGARLNTICYSPNRNLLAAAGAAGVVYMIETKPWRLQLLGGSNYGGEIYDLAFSPQGNFLAAGGATNSVILWDTIQKQRLGSINGLPDHAWSIAFGAGENLLAIACRNGHVSLWQLF